MVTYYLVFKERGIIMTKKENTNLAAKVILISKKTEYEVAESINKVLETEKENGNKLIYLPK